MRVLFVLISLLATFFLAGCGNRESQLEGKWQLSNFDSGSATVNPAVTKQINAIKSTVILEVKKDKTFSLILMQAISGSWSIRGSEVTLNPISFNGRSIEDLTKEAMAMAKDNPTLQQKIEESSKASQTLVGSLSEDGKTLTVKHTNGQGGTLTFAKIDSA